PVNPATSFVAGAALTDNTGAGLQVEILDAAGNVVTNATTATSITLKLAQNPGSVPLNGGVTQPTVLASGVAAFSNGAAGPNVQKVGTGYVLVATAPGLTSDTSTAFDVSAAGA